MGLLSWVEVARSLFMRSSGLQDSMGSSLVSLPSKEPIVLEFLSGGASGLVFSPHCSGPALAGGQAWTCSGRHRTGTAGRHHTSTAGSTLCEAACRSAGHSSARRQRCYFTWFPVFCSFLGCHFFWKCRVNFGDGYSFIHLFFFLWLFVVGFVRQVSLRGPGSP